MLFLAHVILAAQLARVADIRPKRKKRQTDQHAIVEDVEFLLDSGATEDEITSRLGYSDRDNLRRSLDRLGRRNILDRLSRARRDDPEYWRAGS